MQQLSLLAGNQYKLVRGFFPPTYPNLPMILGILEGLIPGQVWVDSASAPHAVLVLSQAPYGFLAGEISSELFVKIDELLRKKPVVKLTYEPNPTQSIDLTEFGFTISPRFQLTLAQNKRLRIFSSHKIKRNSFSQDLIILPKQINNEPFFKRCIWHTLIESIYGTARQYFRHSFGYALWDETNQLVISEAHAISCQTKIEIVTVTHEDYRGQGFATSVCQLLLEEAFKRNLKPVWSCEQTNLVSINLANRLGLDEMKEYFFYIRE